MCSRFRACPLLSCFLSSASFPIPATQLSVSSVPFSSRPRLTVAFPVLRSFFSVLPIFPLLFRLISHASFPVLSTWLSVCFLSPFPDSLPTAVPQVLTLCFHFRYFPVLFRFLSSASFPVPATQPLRFLFPSSRFSLAVVLSGANLSAFRSACCHASLSALVLSLLFFLSPTFVSPRSGYLVRSSFLSVQPIPLS